MGANSSGISHSSSQTRYNSERKHRGVMRSIALLSEKPSVKIAKAFSTKSSDNQSVKTYKTAKSNDSKGTSNTVRVWKTTKQLYIPPFPTRDDEERAIIEGGYRCKYCKDVCESRNLKCKVCGALAHIDCLFNRGHLSKLEIPKNTNDSTWSCADCNDLTKLLSEDEMIKLINLFDELDSDKDCLVRCNQYIDMKKKICEDYGEPMSFKEEEIERRNFRLMDTSSAGTITWNEFINYQAPSLLSKKNKVELSNKLSLKELVLIKKRFAEFDKTNMGFISKDEAKIVYADYYDRLKKKLGRIFMEHLKNCEQLFGLDEPIDDNKTDNNNNNNSNLYAPKVTWEEFVRKMTILILFDRINSLEFAPKFWKPGNWYSTDPLLYQRQRTKTFFKPAQTTIPSKRESSRQLNSRTLMHHELKAENLKLYNDSDFGSHLYVIRSHRHEDDESSSDEKSGSPLQVRHNTTNNNDNSSNHVDNHRVKFNESTITNRNFDLRASKVQFYAHKNRLAITPSVQTVNTTSRLTDIDDQFAQAVQQQNNNLTSKPPIPDYILKTRQDPRVIHTRGGGERNTVALQQNPPPPITTTTATTKRSQIETAPVNRHRPPAIPNVASSSSLQLASTNHLMLQQSSIIKAKPQTTNSLQKPSINTQSLIHFTNAFGKTRKLNSIAISSNGPINKINNTNNTTSAITTNTSNNGLNNIFIRNSLFKENNNNFNNSSTNIINHHHHRPNPFNNTSNRNDEYFPKFFEESIIF